MERKAVLVITLTALLFTVTIANILAPVKAQGFLQITTDKSVYALGEEVRVTIKNVGDVPVEIGGYPCVTIYTYPNLEPVWPTIFAFLIWGLAPEESKTWTWNQYNEYTQSPAKPGMYTVKFSASSNPSAEVIEAFFELSGAIEEWVPYVPLPNMVDLVFWTEKRTAYINVTVTFSDAGYKVSDWGTVVIDGFEIWADSKIWDWTGPAALVITTFRHTYDLGYLKEGNYTFTFKAWGLPVKSTSFTIAPLIVATVNIDPYTLNLKSRGEWITAYIELPACYDVNNIDVLAIRLNDTFSVDFTAPKQIGDYDMDGIPDLMVKFNGTQLQSHIYHVLGIRYGSVTVKITGQLYDGTPFEGFDTIFVNYAGDSNNDGVINLFDAALVSAHWYPGPPIGLFGYDSNADFDNDGTVNIIDAGIISVNWEQTVP